MAETDPHQWRLELATAVLLALATVGTAWAAYEARQWTGEQALAYSAATSKRIAVNRAAAAAARQTQVDVATFIQWVDAREQGRRKLAEFYRSRFGDEFRPAFDAWLATQPFENPAAPVSPFVMPQYELKASEESDRLEVKAAADTERARDANQRAANYMLAVVFFASSLFFAGVSMRLRTTRFRTAMLAAGWIVFLVTVVLISFVPTRVTL